MIFDGVGDGNGRYRYERDSWVDIVFVFPMHMARDA